MNCEAPRGCMRSIAVWRPHGWPVRMLPKPLRMLTLPIGLIVLLPLLLSGSSIGMTICVLPIKLLPRRLLPVRLLPMWLLPMRLLPRSLLTNVQQKRSGSDSG